MKGHRYRYDSTATDDSSGALMYAQATCISDDIGLSLHGTSTCFVDSAIYTAMFIDRKV